jgi:ornithine carbamoyltransferase
MKHIVELKDCSKDDIKEIFHLANQIKEGIYKEELKGKTFILFFPNSSIRTRVTFEKGIHMLSGQSILFSNEALDKKEDIKDVLGYLCNWADGIIIRHNNANLIHNIAMESKIPIINGMSSTNHPCEILSDLYGIKNRTDDFSKLKYTYIGPNSNIGRTWAQAAKIFGLDFIQSCPKSYEIADTIVEYNIKKAIENRDVILTDSLAPELLKDFNEYQVTKALMQSANKNAMLNPCPPFYRGEEVSSEVMDSDYFVGYDFKSCLLEIQQAILLYCLSSFHR